MRWIIIDEDTLRLAAINIQLYNFVGTILRVGLRIKNYMIFAEDNISDVVQTNWQNFAGGHVFKTSSKSLCVADVEDKRNESLVVWYFELVD